MNKFNFIDTNEKVWVFSGTRSWFFRLCICFSLFFFISSIKIFLPQKKKKKNCNFFSTSFLPFPKPLYQNTLTRAFDSLSNNVVTGFYNESWLYIFSLSRLILDYSFIKMMKSFFFFFFFLIDMMKSLSVQECICLRLYFQMVKRSLPIYHHQNWTIG